MLTHPARRSGIATCFLRAGYEVTLVDVNPDGLARGEKTIQGNLAQDVKRGRASQEKVSRKGVYGIQQLVVARPETISNAYKTSYATRYACRRRRRT